MLFPGELFGLEALTDVSYPLTAVALRDCEICAAPREDFSTYLRTNPDIAIGMVRFLVGELERVRTQMTDMSFKDARMKLATFLLSLITPDTPTSNGTVNLTLPLSRHGDQRSFGTLAGNDKPHPQFLPPRAVDRGAGTAHGDSEPRRT